MRPLIRSLLASFAVSVLCASLLQAAEQGPASASAATAAHAPAKPQSSCPVMGGDIGPKDKALHVDVKGKRIYICCAACEAAILADPDTYIKKIEQRGETVEDAPKP